MPRFTKISSTIFGGNLSSRTDSHVQKHEIPGYNKTTSGVRLVYESFLDSLERVASWSHAYDDSGRPQFFTESIFMDPISQG